MASDLSELARRLSVLGVPSDLRATVRALQRSVKSLGRCLRVLEALDKDGVLELGLASPVRVPRAEAGTVSKSSKSAGDSRRFPSAVDSSELEMPPWLEFGELDE